MPNLNLNFTPFPVLETERLILRSTKLSDAESMFFQRSDPQMMKYLDRAPLTKVEEAEERITDMIDKMAKNEWINWVMAEKANPDLMIGDLGFWRIEDWCFRAEIGYGLQTKYQGKGYMAEAMQAVLQYGFEVMNLNSVKANIKPINNGSRAVLKRAGFIKEAYHREDYYYNGKFTDSEIYCLLKRDFLGSK